MNDPIKIQYNANAFAAKVASLIDKTIDGIQGILEQNALNTDDLDVFLVVRDAAQAPPMFDILSHAFEGKPRRATPSFVAIGAAWQAVLRAESSTESTPAQFNSPVSLLAEEARLSEFKPVWEQAGFETNAELAEVIEHEPQDADQHDRLKKPESEAFGDGALEAARRLIEQGRWEEAATILNAIEQEVKDLKSKLLDKEFTAPRRLIQQAQSMSNIGQFLHAVSLTRQAYEQARDDPEVFSAMMKIHAGASLKLDSPEEYDAAIHILNCAHSHDPTDKKVHSALAERHYMHALVMRNLNNFSDAVSISELALSFDPKHEGANKLLEELRNTTAASELHEIWPVV